jgi:hypothetical protein
MQQSDTPSAALQINNNRLSCSDTTSLPINQPTNTTKKSRCSKFPSQHRNSHHTTDFKVYNCVQNSPPFPSCDRSIQSTTFNPISSRSTLILSFLLCLSLPHDIITFQHIPRRTSLLPHRRSMNRTSHQPSNIWWAQLYAIFLVSYHLLFHRPKYLHADFTLRPTHKTRPTTICTLNFTLLHGKRKDKIPHRMWAGIRQINFSTCIIFICCVVRNYSKLVTFSDNLLAIFMFPFCPAF